ncbi:hypothetical protein EYF80_034733 [Liparis tanakae]|uniref:Uncharacterized protein n=1 Tax=Liparis tanakae TaxID=230148 RepID=A0A4Z2GN89_9TELE|nr:hypothetical protein EYF80_034733 [Liparis tanakae]
MVSINVSALVSAATYTSQIPSPALMGPGVRACLEMLVVRGNYSGSGAAECQPGLLAGCGKVNGGGKTSYCVTLERNGEGRPSVSSGLPYPQSKWTRAARGEATDTHRAKPTAHHGLSSLPGRGRRAAARTDSARRPPPTCPEVSGSAEVTPTYLPRPLLNRRRDGRERHIGGDELCCVG